jgi:hypothetical protein
MELEFVFKRSAFKHGYTEADVRNAFKTAIYDADIEGFDNKYILIGFDMHALPIEVIYNEFGDNGKNVFHVDSAQEKNKRLLGLEGV